MHRTIGEVDELFGMPAMEAFEEALKLNPNDATARANLARLRAQVTGRH
jgi:hypothetical protein